MLAAIQRQSPTPGEGDPTWVGRVWKFVSSWWEVPHVPDDEDDKGLFTPRRYHKPGWLKRLIYFLVPGRVSRIHLYEAQERYLNLSRMLDYHQAVGQQDETKRTVMKQAGRILRDAQWLLTRRQSDLNYLWRELARVQIMLVEYVLPNEFLPKQLDLCREEARRVGSTDESTIKEMLERLAEATPEGEPSIVDAKRERMVRGIRALIERFTTIRTDRIHQQFVNIRTYQKALIVLLILSGCLIGNKDFVLGPPKPATAAQAAGIDEGEGGSSLAAPTELQTTEVAKAAPTPPAGSRDESSTATPSAGSVWEASPAESSLLVNTWTKFRNFFGKNILFFVFFAGLTGGFFSVVMRLRDRNLVPGEDAYFLWYVLSKPFVGALGAMILYILMQADFVTWEIAKGLADELRSQKPGAAVFGFAFLSGFSERIVFPHFR